MKFKDEISLKGYLNQFIKRPYEFGILIHIGNYILFKVYPSTLLFETTPHKLQSLNDPDARIIMWIRKLNNGEYLITEH